MDDDKRLIMIEGLMHAAVVECDSDVAPYLDLIEEEAIHVAADATAYYLPVIAVETGGYVEFPPYLRDEVSAYFGTDREAAEQRVEQINSNAGLEPDDATALVGQSMGNGNLPPE